MSKQKKLALILIIILFFGIFYGLSKQILGSLQAGKRLERETEELVQLQKKNIELKKELIEVQTPQFIEREARDKLNFSRPNETVIIIPEEEIDKVLGIEKKIGETKIPNWQGWLKLFWR